jgi:glyoxylase-like metal-dependent hydrolase (beta-lactamase superfamily II)
MQEPIFTRASSHVWVIHGKDRSRFPSGNALLIKSGDKLVLVDTNPGFGRIEAAMAEIGAGSCTDLTDIVLSHTHLDHGQGLADVFETGEAVIHALPDTLARCEKRARVGLWAGIPEAAIPRFEAVGQKLGFRDRSYPRERQHDILDGDTIQFGDVRVTAHESFGHCVHVLDFELKDEGTRAILSCDYDFTTFPFYGIPQRGDSIDMFLQDTQHIADRLPDMIISSHRIDIIPQANFRSELARYQAIIDARTQRSVEILGEDDVAISDVDGFVYPIDKMVGRYSDAYIHCAKVWDAWMLLAHLEKAWSLGLVECTDSGGDSFLERCIERGCYLPREGDEKTGLEWAEATLAESAPWAVPVESRWRRILSA